MQDAESFCFQNKLLEVNTITIGDSISCSFKQKYTTASCACATLLKTERQRHVSKTSKGLEGLTGEGLRGCSAWRRLRRGLMTGGVVGKGLAERSDRLESWAITTKEV